MIVFFLAAGPDDFLPRKSGWGANCGAGSFGGGSQVTRMQAAGSWQRAIGEHLAICLGGNTHSVTQYIPSTTCISKHGDHRWLTNELRRQAVTTTHPNYAKVILISSTILGSAAASSTLPPPPTPTSSWCSLLALQ